MDEIVLNFAGAAKFAALAFHALTRSFEHKNSKMFKCPLRLLKSSVGKQHNGRAVVKGIQQCSNKCHSSCKLEFFSATA